MGQLRMERVQELMKQEISKIILEDLKDPRVGFVTVTRVHVTSDLRSARVYVSLMGTDEQMADSLRGLNRSLGFIRREVGHRVRLRYTPELSLELDDTMAYSAHIQELLLRVRKEQTEKGGEQRRGGKRNEHQGGASRRKTEGGEKNPDHGPCQSRRRRRRLGAGTLGVPARQGKASDRDD